MSNAASKVLNLLHLRSKTFSIFAGSLWLLACGLAQPTAGSDPGQDQRLKRFLQSYERHAGVGDERNTRYAAASVDLKDDGTQELIVYLMGPLWCGSGGCTSLILMPEGSSYRVITKTTITWLPIRLLSTKTNGWRDLGVQVGGGGILHGYEARLQFNGRKYPSNPSVPPARKLQKDAEGKVVIPDNTKGTPLYSD